jgi:hypothetical protein
MTVFFLSSPFNFYLTRKGLKTESHFVIFDVRARQSQSTKKKKTCTKNVSYTNNFFFRNSIFFSIFNDCLACGQGKNKRKETGTSAAGGQAGERRQIDRNVKIKTKCTHPVLLFVHFMFFAIRKKSEHKTFRWGYVYPCIEFVYVCVRTSFSFHYWSCPKGMIMSERVSKCSRSKK